MPKSYPLLSVMHGYFIDYNVVIKMVTGLSKVNETISTTVLKLSVAIYYSCKSCIRASTVKTLSSHHTVVGLSHP